MWFLRQTKNMQAKHAQNPINGLCAVLPYIFSSAEAMASGFMGFEMKPVIPASLHRCLSASNVFAVIAIIGISWSA